MNRGLELLGKSLNMFKDGFELEDKTPYELPDFSKMTPDEIREARAALELLTRHRPVQALLKAKRDTSAGRKMEYQHCRFIKEVL